MSNADSTHRDRPEVIVEFVFDRGLLHIAVRNIGTRPAVGVTIKFNDKIVGPDGKKDISALPLFNRIEFLGPGREISTFLGTRDSYFGRKQPTSISVRVSYTDSEKQLYEATINHDLDIYRDLAYVISQPN